MHIRDQEMTERAKIELVFTLAYSYQEKNDSICVFRDDNGVIEEVVAKSASHADYDTPIGLRFNIDDASKPIDVIRMNESDYEEIYLGDYELEGDIELDMLHFVQNKKELLKYKRKDYQIPMELCLTAGDPDNGVWCYEDDSSKLMHINYSYIKKFLENEDADFQKPLPINEWAKLDYKSSHSYHHSRIAHIIRENYSRPIDISIDRNLTHIASISDGYHRLAGYKYKECDTVPVRCTPEAMSLLCNTYIRRKIWEETIHDWQTDQNAPSLLMLSLLSIHSGNPLSSYRLKSDFIDLEVKGFFKDDIFYCNEGTFPINRSTYLIVPIEKSNIIVPDMSSMLKNPVLSCVVDIYLKSNYEADCNLCKAKGIDRESNAKQRLSSYDLNALSHTI